MIRFFLASLLIAQSTVVFTQAQLAEIKKVSYDSNPHDSQPAPASKARYDQILGQNGTLKSSSNSTQTYVWEDSEGRMIEGVFRTNDGVLMRWKSKGF